MLNQSTPTELHSLIANPRHAVAAMFANQAEWLIRNAFGNVCFTGQQHTVQPGDLVMAGSHGIAIGPGTPDAIDTALAWLRRTASTNILVWSATGNNESDLHLVSRGCRDSFRPLWMGKSLELPLPDPGTSAEVEIGLATPHDLPAILAATGVPYVATSKMQHLLDLTTSNEIPKRAWMLVARRKRLFGDDRIVGLAILHLSTFGDDTVGALYNLGVDPSWRGRGIGSALVATIARIARGQGATALVLNATEDGARVYRRQGFVELGSGQTWHLPADSLRAYLAPEAVNVAEALARGETSRLDPAVATWTTLPNGESPVAFAARFGQHATVDWLLAAGAEPDLVALWKMGRRDAATSAAFDPRWRDAQRGPERTTPLHEAIRLNDRDLAEMLIAAGANTQIRDAHWGSRPLEWANAMGRHDLADLIRRAMFGPTG